jgi:hypothetical protein
MSCKDVVDGVGPQGLKEDPMADKKRISDRIDRYVPKKCKGGLQSQVLSFGH